MKLLARIVAIWNAPVRIAELHARSEDLLKRVIDLEEKLEGLEDDTEESLGEKVDLEELDDRLSDLDIPDLEDVERRLDALEGELTVVVHEDNHNDDVTRLSEAIEALKATVTKHGEAGDALADRVVQLELRG